MEISKEKRRVLYSYTSNERLYKGVKLDDPRKLLFLDMDGVLNSYAFYKSNFYQKEKEIHGSKVKQYDLKKLDLLKEIHDKTNCTIVMSSSWKIFYFDSKFQMDCGCLNLKQDLKERGIEINYFTGGEYNEKWYTIYSGYKWVKNKDGTYHSEYVEPENRKKPPKVRRFYERGLQIKNFKDEWEKEHGKCNFAILDDDDGDFHLFGKHFVRTSWYEQKEEEAALTPKHVQKCIKLLNRR